MSTNFADIAWPVPGGVDRTNGDRCAKVYNVKDWGAVGDGVHNDRPHIQAAMDECFPLGTVASGGDTYCYNALYFPPGNYRCTDFGFPSIPSNEWGGNNPGAAVLSINTGRAGRLNFVCMFGDSSATTRIFYDGPYLVGVRANTILLNLDNHVERSLFQGLHFDMPTTPAGPPPTNLGEATICIWNRGRTLEGTAINAGHNCWWIDIKCSNATNGLAFSGEAAALGSENILLWCKIDNCYKGIVTFSSNALGYTIFGGYMKNCGTNAICGQQGACVTVSGVEFANNCPHTVLYNGVDQGLGDFSSQNAQVLWVAGCTSTSIDFTYYNSITICLTGNYHHASEAGAFLSPYSKVALDNNYSTNGAILPNDKTIEADGGLYLRSNRFDLVGAISSAYLPAGAFAAGVKEPSPWDATYNQLA